MPNWSKNDIILVRYPFSDLSSSKVRPTVVVGALKLLFSLACRMQACPSEGRVARFNSWVRGYSGIAQLVESAAVNRVVVGSSPTPGANSHPCPNR